MVGLQSGAGNTMRQWRRSLWLCLSLAILAAVILPVASLADDELDYGLQTHRLARIEIRGNLHFTSGMLKSLLRLQESSWKRPLHVPKYRPHMLDTQVRILENFYHNQGFHQAKVSLDSITTMPGQGDVLHFAVQEGLPTTIGKVVFVGGAPLTDAELLAVLRYKTGMPAPADLNALGGDIFSIRDLYRGRAYLRAKVSPAWDISALPDSSGFLADLTYTIAPGRKFQVGSISLQGNVITKDHLLRRELEFATGEPLYWLKVEDSRRNLLSTSLFRDVNIVPVRVDTAAGVADIKVEVLERKPAFYELGVGVGSQERIRTLASWGHYNLRGTGNRLQVRARGSWNLEDVVGNSLNFNQGQINFRVDTDYVNPRIRDSRYSLDFNIFMHRDTRGESGLNMLSYGFNLGSTWKASRRVTNNVYLGLKLTDPTVHPYAPESLKDRFYQIGANYTEVRSFNWSMYIDHRDDIFRPTNGMYTTGTLRIAGGALGGDFSFIKGSAAWHKYASFPLGGVLASRIMVGAATPYGGSLAKGPDGVPYDDRFFAGGATTVRGYDHNSLGPQVANQDELDLLNYTSDVLLPNNPARGGNYLLLTNVEWRFPLPLLRSWKLSSVMFFDGGNVWARFSDLRWRAFRMTSDPGDPNDPGSTKVWDYRYSWGTGLRLDTPFGPVRVDLGIPLKRVRYIGEGRDYKDPARIWHFSLGYPF